MAEYIALERPLQPLPFTGERMTGAADGQIEIEHLHRYVIARDLCRSKDVLDIASGEGYGAALLAQTARNVIGVEIDPVAVAHAAAQYRAPNLKFVAGDARKIPLAARSVDAVVSFETLEHIGEHELFVSEVVRVLRPGGLFCISTPDRDVYGASNNNPFHVKELSKAEFAALLQRRFRHLRLTTQKPIIGSVIVAAYPMPSDNPLMTFNRDQSGLEQDVALAAPPYLIALASDAPLPILPHTSVYVDAVTMDHLSEQVRAARRDRDIAMAECQLQVEKLKAAKRRLFSAAHELKARSRETEARLRAAEAELVLLQIRLQQIETSRSWRLTRPLRHALFAASQICQTTLAYLRVR